MVEISLKTILSMFSKLVLVRIFAFQFSFINLSFIIKSQNKGFSSNFRPKSFFRNFYSYPSYIIFTLSMLCWYLVQLNFWEHEEGDNDQTGQNREEHIGSSVEEGSTMDIPFNVLSLAGIMLLVLIIQSYRNLALRCIKFSK